MKTVFLAILAVTLSGCLGTFTSRDPSREILAACGAIEHAMVVLTPNIDRLTVEQVDIVLRADEIARPICTAESPPDSQLSFVMGALASIAEVETAAIGGL